LASQAEKLRQQQPPPRNVQPDPSDPSDMPFSLAPSTQTQAPSLPTDPASRIEAVSAALRKALGLRRLPARLQVVHTTAPVTLANGTQRQWQARVRSGRIEINAANIPSAESALWNLEHELAHEAFRDPSPALKRAWNRLTQSLANHPDIRAEVETLRYTPDQLTEEQAVRLAQQLDAQGPWSAAWAALKEALYDLLTGQWGNLTPRFTDRIAAALAARAIMANARRRLRPDPSDSSDLSDYFEGTEIAGARYSFAPDPSQSPLSIDNRSQPLNVPGSVTPAQAYDAILQPANPQLRDRSEEAARRTLECAQELIRATPGETFGWNRRQKRERLLDGQLAILSRHAQQDTAPGEPIGQGGEHQVWHLDGDSHVSKFTNKDQFGYVVDQENDNRANKLHLRPALPSEYLMRLGTQNAAFGDAITLQGIRAGRVPSIITAQPEADQGRPSQTDVDAFLWQSGFIRLPDDMMMGAFSTKPFWWRPADSILVGDSNPENYSRITDDIIVPIDVISHPIPRSLIEQTAAQNGVNLDRLIAEDSQRREAFARQQSGRAQPLDAPVLTPDGYRPIGTLAIGDALISTDGRTSTLTGTYPQGRKQVFKLTLADGRTVRATEDHLWIPQIQGNQLTLPVTTKTLAWNCAKPA